MCIGRINDTKRSILTTRGIKTTIAPFYLNKMAKPFLRTYIYVNTLLWKYFFLGCGRTMSMQTARSHN
jgi:hypothetical protein